MSMKAVKNIVATVGEYTDRDGNKKKRYQTCGVVFKDDDGRVSLKLDAVPVSPDWSGWFALYDRDPAPAARAEGDVQSGAGDDLNY